MGHQPRLDVAQAARESDDGLAIETQALIVGAGPVGLFQAFELGLLEIKAHIVDSLTLAGGQCVELYPDKPIYDIPAVPVCTGRSLTDNLLKQIEPFGATFHLSQEVSEIELRADGRFDVRTSKGKRFLAQTIFVAGGVGSFQTRELRVAGLNQFNGAQVFYCVDEPVRFAGKKLIIVGGNDAALNWTMSFVAPGPLKAESVTLVHRREEFTAEPALVSKMRELCDAQELQLFVGQVTGFEKCDNRLRALTITGNDATVRVAPLDALLVFLGLSPKLGPIARWGLDLDRKQVVVNTENFETNVAGIFAVGDVNTYPGKKKLILSGFHEATLAAFGAARYIFPDKPVHLQYTTTSPKLHERLRVASSVSILTQ